jgi:hypothetical protein
MKSEEIKVFISNREEALENLQEIAIILLPSLFLDSAV